jgi:hypothetical protein
MLITNGIGKAGCRGMKKLLIALIVIAFMVVTYTPEYKVVGR